MKWVTIIKVEYGDNVRDEVKKYYNQYLNRAFPVVEKSNNDSFRLAIRHFFTGESTTLWEIGEVRPSTKEEVRLGELELGAEKI